MKEWNILATSLWGQERRLFRFLRNFGDFKGSGFRNVILGKVEDVPAFLEAIEEARRTEPERLRSLGQIVPIERIFHFDVAGFDEKAKEAVAPYIVPLENSNFFVRVVRRGHKGEISSQETEKMLDGYILESLQKEG
ncbi:MAG: hypothetical protein IBX61_05555, partial [Thermoleophilia bacterium]|nr:hypothetical protein [Thermoleophilia bacterium]